MICEHLGCQETQGVRDYRRLPSDLEEDEEGPMSEEDKAEWAEEPVALCHFHAKDHERL